MNTVLEMRVRAAAAEMNKPGHWRTAQAQLLQAVSQLFAETNVDHQVAGLAFDALTGLYSYMPAMRPDELSALNAATWRLHCILNQDK